MNNTYRSLLIKKGMNVNFCYCLFGRQINCVCSYTIRKVRITLQTSIYPMPYNMSYIFLTNYKCRKVTLFVANRKSSNKLAAAVYKDYNVCLSNEKRCYNPATFFKMPTRIIFNDNQAKFMSSEKKYSMEHRKQKNVPVQFLRCLPTIHFLAYLKVYGR
jgi:hypothetical protein